MPRRTAGWRAGAMAWLAALSLAGCGKSDSDPGPGGVTVGEARTLDQAAAMLDKQSLPAVAATAAPKAATSPPAG